MSARELARRVGIGETPMGRILNGETVPGTDTLAAICEALQVHPSWVLKGFEPRYYEDTLAAVEQAPLRPQLGVERWLNETAEGRAVTDNEREWLQHGVAWLAPHIRQADAVYQLALLAFRQMVTSPSSASLEPIVVPTTKRVG